MFIYFSKFFGDLTLHNDERQQNIFVNFDKVLDHSRQIISSDSNTDDLNESEGEVADGDEASLISDASKAADYLGNILMPDHHNIS